MRLRCADGLARWRSLVLLLLLALSACGSTSPLVHKAGPRPSPTLAPGAAASTNQAPGVGEPVRLVIAAIGINAPVEPVGVQANGDLATPTQNRWEDVGWYAAGPRPGERGSAVMDGHVDRTGEARRSSGV